MASAKRMRLAILGTVTQMYEKHAHKGHGWALGIAVVGSMAIYAGAIGLASLSSVARADSAVAAPILVLPVMNPEHGKQIFASKGCVVCHSINGVGGIDAAPLDASNMDPAKNPFEFFARMLAGMTPMLAMQEQRLGHEVELDAAEFGDLVAFIHDEAAQQSFSKKDIPEEIKRLLEQD